MNKLLVIAGPTATGKTGLGTSLAQKFNGEIVSADSRQVYRGMDIITGKDLPASAKLKVKSEKLQIKIKKDLILKPYRFNYVPVWLLDVVRPDQKFSVADYYRLAWKVIEDIWQRGRLPMVVGGTGFYIKALLEKIETIGVEPNWGLRKELQAYPVTELQKILENIDPGRSRRMNQSDWRNPRRLVRAIEVALKNKSGKAKTKIEFPREKTDKLLIGLTAPYPILYARIDQRVDERVKKGAEKEIKGLLEKGYRWNNSVLGSTIGYKEWQDFFEKKADRKQVIQSWKFAEHAYARRQMTWFKKSWRQLGGSWFGLNQAENKKVEKLVKAWYS